MNYKKLFFLGVILSMAVLCFAPTPMAKAVTAEVQAQINAILAQIASLQEQIAQLQAQQGTTSAIPDHWCHTFNTNLGYTNSGSDEVVNLHTALQSEGISYSPDGASTYANGTAAGVVSFQEKYASDILEPSRLTRGTGFVGASTRTKLNALYGCGVNQTNQIIRCVSNWQAGTWSTCTNGQQTRTVTDSNNCGTTIDKPAISQSCTATCTPNWQVGTWSACTNGQQTRTVTDSNNCGLTTEKPVTTQSCAITTHDRQSGYTCTKYNSLCDPYDARTIAYWQDLLHIEWGGCIYRAHNQNLAMPAAEACLEWTLPPPPPDTSGFNFTFPAGGEKIQLGTPMKITWARGTVPSGKYRISLIPFMAGSISWPGSTGLVSNIGYLETVDTSSFAWDGKTVCKYSSYKGDESGCFSIVPGTYVIGIEPPKFKYGYWVYEDYFTAENSKISKPFTIIPATAQQSSITINSPKSGEIWEIDQPQTISWSTTGFSPNAIVTVRIKGVAAGYNVDMGFAQTPLYFKNTGSATYTPPATVRTPNAAGIWEQRSTIGSYYLKLYITEGGNATYSGVTLGSTNSSTFDPTGGDVSTYTRGGTFNIVAPIIKSKGVNISPTNCIIDRPCTIRWTYGDGVLPSQDLKIEFMYPDMFGFTTIVGGDYREHITVGQGSYIWQVPKSYKPGDNYGLRARWNYSGCLEKNNDCGWSTANLTLSYCKENWVCNNWGACANGVQTRICTEANACGTVADKPLEVQFCNGVIPPISSTCTDTDGGLNYNVAGGAYGGNINSPTPMVDSCITSGDYTGYLYEVWCGKGPGGIFYPQPGAYKCPYGCSAGKCNKGSACENWSCTNWSSCTGWQTRTCTDSNHCGTTLDKPIESQACNISSASAPCVDSNGGLNYYKKGIMWLYVQDTAGGTLEGQPTIIVQGTQQPAQSVEDKCSDSKNVVKNYCDPVLGSPITKTYTCPNGCLDGACIGTCPVNWQVGVWGECYNGQKTRKVTDLNSCGVTTDKPIDTISCPFSVAITSPARDNIWPAGETHNITWTSQNLGSNNISIYLKAQGSLNASTPLLFVASVPANSGSYSWTIPETISGVSLSTAGLFQVVISVAPPSSTNFYGDIFTVAQSCDAGHICVSPVTIDTCRLETLAGVRLTSNAIGDQTKCLSTFCDVYGSGNAKKGTSSNCVFNGGKIKTYTPTNPSGVVSSSTSTSTTATCTDSDGGSSYLTNGTVSISYPASMAESGVASIQSYQDYCSSTSALIEYSCNSDNTLKTETHTCPGASCLNGVCRASVLAPNNSQLLGSISDALANITKAIQEMMNK